ncbi:MAG: efflux RND transporter periplasmic adaptor subunit [Pseudomonadota bacterium]
MKKALGVIVVAIIIFCSYVAIQNYSSESENDSQKSEAKIVPVVIAAVTEKVFKNPIQALGRAEASESVDLSVNVTDFIREIRFTEGQQVKQDEILILLERSQQQADLVAAQAQLTDSERELNRLKQLVKKGAVSQSEIDMLQTQRSITLSQIDSIEASIEQRVIKAPFSGTLGLRQRSIGSLVQPGDIVVTLDDLSKMRVEFSLPTQFLSVVEIASTVEARSNALPNKIFTGQITAIDGRSDIQSDSMLVRAEIDNAAGKLKSGMLLNVKVLGPTRTVLVVPEEAVLQRGRQHYIFIAQKNRAFEKEIKIGERDTGWVEVTKGLTKEDWIVARGMDRLANNNPIKVQERWEKPLEDLPIDENSKKSN